MKESVVRMLSWIEVLLQLSTDAPTLAQGAFLLDSTASELQEESYRQSPSKQGSATWTDVLEVKAVSQDEKR